MKRWSKAQVCGLVAVLVAGMAAPVFSQDAVPGAVNPAEVKPAAPVPAAPVAPAAVKPVEVKPVAPAPVAPAVPKEVAKPHEIPMTAAPSTGDSFYESYIKGKLEIGARVTYLILLEDQRGERDDPPSNPSFVGTVTALREDQSMPVKLYAQYLLTSYFGAGISYDKFGAVAWDEGRGVAGTTGSDGTTFLSGPVLYLIGRVPNESGFTPFAEVGVAFYSVDFEESSGWGTDKQFVLNDTDGIYLAAGCDWSVNGNWAIDVYARYMSVDVDGLFQPYGEEILFTMSNLTTGVGVKYTF